MRRTLVISTIGIGLLIAPACQAWAATTIGETFDPTDGGVCSPAPRTFLQTAPDQYVVPSAGVITSWSYQAAASPPQLRLKVARPQGGDMFLIVGESSPQAPGPNALATYPTRISVEAGDALALTITADGECYRNVAPSYHWRNLFADPAVGTSPTFDADNTGLQFDIAASLEPDADHDGFGDETQDQCPTNASTQGPCPPGSTGQRGAELKRCKKKHSKLARRKCRKKATLLPV